MKKPGPEIFIFVFYFSRADNQLMLVGDWSWVQYLDHCSFATSTWSEQTVYCSSRYGDIDLIKDRPLTLGKFKHNILQHNSSAWLHALAATLKIQNTENFIIFMFLIYILLITRLTDKTACPESIGWIFYSNKIEPDKPCFIITIIK